MYRLLQNWQKTQVKTFGWKIFSCTICGIQTKLHITSAVTPVDAHTSEYSVVITALYHYSTHVRTHTHTHTHTHKHTHTHRTDGQRRWKQHQLHWSGWEWLKLGHIDTGKGCNAEGASCPFPSSYRLFHAHLWNREKITGCFFVLFFSKSVKPPESNLAIIHWRHIWR